jgi:hypothetical protein
LFYTVYKITNTVNGKFYIGKHQTKDLDDGYFGSGKLLKRAIEKYGKDNFVKRILRVCCSEKEMDLVEKILVVPDPEISYNLCNGGNGGFSYINSTLRLQSRGAKKANERGAYILGAIASSKLKGNLNSQYGTCWITNGQENRKIKKDELDIWLEKGYYKGRKI